MTCVLYKIIQIKLHNIMQMEEEEEEQSESLVIRANAEKLTSLLANA